MPATGRISLEPFQKPPPFVPRPFWGLSDNGGLITIARAATDCFEC